MKKNVAFTHVHLKIGSLTKNSVHSFGTGIIIFTKHLNLKYIRLLQH